jgi:hypothetical protein
MLTRFVDERKFHIPALDEYSFSQLTVTVTAQRYVNQNFACTYRSTTLSTQRFPTKCLADLLVSPKTSLAILGVIAVNAEHQSVAVHYSLLRPIFRTLFPRRLVLRRLALRRVVSCISVLGSVVSRRIVSRGVSFYNLITLRSVAMVLGVSQSQTSNFSLIERESNVDTNKNDFAVM